MYIIFCTTFKFRAFSKQEKKTLTLWQIFEYFKITYFLGVPEREEEEEAGENEGLDRSEGEGEEAVAKLC